MRFRGNDVTESYASAALEQSTGTPEEARPSIAALPAALLAGGRPVETGRRTSPGEALGLLEPASVPAAAWRLANLLSRGDTRFPQHGKEHECLGIS